jgi:membrane protein involved in colicin uptake
MAALRAEREASDKARQKAEAAKRAAEEAQRKAEEAAKAVQAPAQAPAPKGVSEVIDFEVTDLQAFHAKFPQLCTVTVNRAAVLAALQKSLAKKGTLPEVVGLRVFQNLRIGRRAL